MDALAAGLEALPSFQRSGGRNFLFVTTHYNPVRIFGLRLLGVLQAGPAWIATADKSFGEMQILRPRGEGLVTIPYKAHYLLEAAAWDQTRRSAPGLTFMFHGCTKRSSPEGELRGTFVDMLRDLPGASLVTVSYSCDHQYATDLDLTRQASRFTVATYLNASFCFVLPGDSPTSRRLFDGLAAGCMPIVMGDPAEAVPNLPFHASLDWSWT